MQQHARRGSEAMAKRKALADKTKAGRGADYPHPTNAAVSAVMRANRKKDTGPELAVRKLLFARGYRYRVNFKITVEGLSVRPDIVFVGCKVAVFVDGCFWHGCPVHGNMPKANATYWSAKRERNRLRDEKVNRILKENGWLIVRIWEHVDPSTGLDVIAAALRE